MQCEKYFKRNTVQSDYDHKNIEKNKIRKQEPKVLAVESDNRGLEDLPQACFARVLEKISSVGEEIVNS